MGAVFITKTFNTTSCLEVEKSFETFVKNCKRMYGNNPYNGSFSTMSGLRNSSKVFSDRIEAERYIEDNTEKWGCALAVEVREENKKPYTLIGGWAAE